MNCCYLYTNNCGVSEYIGYYQDLLYKSIKTLIAFYKDNIDNIYILIDNNIDYDTLNDIKIHINSITNNVNVIYKLIDLHITNCIKYPENNVNKTRINRIGLLKFFIPYLVDCNNVLYIDCDILFNGNVINDIYKDYNQNTTLFKIYKHGWNSGLILFNCDKWRQNKTLLNDIIDFYNIDSEKIDLVDNRLFIWLSFDSKYSSEIIKDCNDKINYFNEELLLKDIDSYVKNNNIIHVEGYFDIKIRNFNNIYNHINI